VEQYPAKVVAIHEGKIIFTGEQEADVYRRVREAGLEPMPLVFRVPREQDLQSVLKSGYGSIGFDYRAGDQVYLQVGDGSFIPAYLHDLELQVGTEQFSGKVGFSDKLGMGFNLLGRAGIFERFKICFNESQGILTFE